MMRVPQDVLPPRVLIDDIGNLIWCRWCSVCVSLCGALTPDIHLPANSSHMPHPFLSLHAHAFFGALLCPCGGGLSG